MTDYTASLIPITSPETELANFNVLKGYTPHLRGGAADSDDSDSGYEADSEKNDDESADEDSGDERESSSSGGTSTAADHWEDSDGDSDNCYTSGNGS